MATRYRKQRSRHGLLKKLSAALRIDTDFADCCPAVLLFVHCVIRCGYNPKSSRGSQSLTADVKIDKNIGIALQRLFTQS